MPTVAAEPYPNIMRYAVAAGHSLVQVSVQSVVSRFATIVAICAWFVSWSIKGLQGAGIVGTTGQTMAISVHFVASQGMHHEQSSQQWRRSHTQT